MLNEIGRVLSSTLDPETLFETILSEMKRLIDVDYFYISLHDPARNEIRFELEVRDGVAQPKRSRPNGDQHVTEYVMRTRQPLLIRENYAEELRKIGLNPRFDHGCLCGVPLLLNERAIGIMAVQSPQERAFDTGHLKMMRVLAGQAVIALENARLFREERTKSRHLTLLNNVSRNIITTFNPDEMLATIAEELEDGLDYSHMGVGLLDYSNKEIVIQAEAGRRKGARGRRLGWDGNVLGRVARTGQMAVVTFPDSSDVQCEPILEGSISAIALPIVYADQLHGVLYIETDQCSDFPQEEILFLGTLADLISGALHNALAYQKAQEQAITDGLTGVKTHRFFMEALSAEWKRSTRTGRSFSVVLMDLDRFKFVNDFYGHLDGDLLLQRVAHILDRNCRRSDVVARYGGDEFVILMPETDAEQSLQIATKLCSWIAADPVLHEKNVTSSFGVANFPMHGSTPQELIQVTDASMYLSKHRGGNAVSTADHFNPDDSKQWKRDVLEAYLGVTLRRLFATGPDAFVEIYGRIEQFARSLSETEHTMPRPDDQGVLKTSASSFEPLPLVVMDTLTSLALAVDARDQFTQGHSHKVSGYAVLIAEAIGLSGSEIEEIRLGSMLHDVGKVGILECVLNKCGPLNPEEWETMKKHTEFGAKLLEPLRGTERIRKIVAHHHEFFDGSGYPDGLAGVQIPLGARIVAIADAYDTITSERIYKKARTPEEAFLELERCSSTQFDPELVRMFVSRLRHQPSPLIEPVLVPEREVLS
jgi:diguanylate cyclase (GGDEF)-like protein/putative nucleotidyltransferase with HDIG domain